MGEIVSTIRVTLEQPGNGGKALDAVDSTLRLHVPLRGPHDHCRHDGYTWPCPTVEAIASALGIQEGGSGGDAD